MVQVVTKQLSLDGTLLAQILIPHSFHRDMKFVEDRNECSVLGSILFKVLTMV